MKTAIAVLLAMLCILVVGQMISGVGPAAILAGKPAPPPPILDTNFRIDPFDRQLVTMPADFGPVAINVTADSDVSIAVLESNSLNAKVVCSQLGVATSATLRCFLKKGYAVQVKDEKHFVDGVAGVLALAAGNSKPMADTSKSNRVHIVIARLTASPSH